MLAQHDLKEQENASLQLTRLKLDTALGAISSGCQDYETWAITIWIRDHRLSLHGFLTHACLYGSLSMDP